MSPSDATRASRFLDLVEKLSDVDHEMRNADWPEPMDMEACGRLLGMAARFYVGAAEQKPEDMAFPALGITPTDAVVVSAAALRDQDLTPFDLTLWFQRVIMETRKSNYFTETAAPRQPALGSNHP